jgi:hypothetical protein
MIQKVRITPIRGRFLANMPLLLYTVRVWNTDKINKQPESGCTPALANKPWFNILWLDGLLRMAVSQRCVLGDDDENGCGFQRTWLVHHLSYIITIV